jgi:hypothetical protein
VLADSPAKPSTRSLSPKALLVAGLLLLVGPGIPFLAVWFLAVPRSTVSRCTLSYSHRNTLIIDLASGDQVFLTSEHLPDVSRCLADGTVIEKRRGELGYRIGNKYQAPTADMVPPGVMVLVGGVLLFARAVLVRRQRRKPGPGRGSSPPSSGS